jgi:thymidylate kinase
MSSEALTTSSTRPFPVAISDLAVAQARWRLLRGVLDLFDSQDIPYCILHGAEAYPAPVTSDVDLIMPPEYLPHRLGLLFSSNRARLGARVVQVIQYKSTAFCYVLAEESPRGEREFLAVDVCSDYRGYGRIFYRGHRILASRRIERGFWIPSGPLEFACYLIKRVGKRALCLEHGRRLSELYQHDPAGCERELARFWRERSVRELGRIAAAGEWAAMQDMMPTLRRELLQPPTARAWAEAAEYWATDAVRRLHRWSVPAGLHVVLLGPDGSGKSSVVSKVPAAVAPAFRRVTTPHFAPALWRRAGGGLPTTAPHDQPPRSLPASVAKALYWALDFSLGYYVRVRVILARAGLVLCDRYLMDALVDPRRYRYAGPMWLLRLVWRMVPHPDMVILLDVTPPLARARKQEVPAWMRRGPSKRWSHRWRSLSSNTWPRGPTGGGRVAARLRLARPSPGDSGESAPSAQQLPAGGWRGSRIRGGT